MNDKSPNYTIKVLNKAFSVLEILLKNNAPMSMNEISEELDFYPSTIHRILDTLKYGGYVEQGPVTQKISAALETLGIRNGQVESDRPGKGSQTLFKRISQKM